VSLSKWIGGSSSSLPITQRKEVTVRRFLSVGKTLILGVPIAAIHFAASLTSLAAIAISAASPEPAKISPDIPLWVFKACSSPVAQLPVDGEHLVLWLQLNSALWGFSLAAAAR
jgi:hypothetical protein